MINLALIGNGKWGKNYLKEIEKISGVQIKYIRTHDYKDLISKKDVDGIIIATPDQTHLQILKDFPNQYILVEKPVVTSLDEFLQLKNPKIMAGHIYLYNLALLDALKDLTGVRSIDFIIRNTERVEHTSPLWHLAVHGVALFIFLLGEPSKVSAHEKNNNLFIELTYHFSRKPSIFCRIEVGWNYSKKERLILVKGDQNLAFDDSKKQDISPLENECRTFVDFIQGYPSISGLEHIKAVTTVLKKIESLIR